VQDIASEYCSLEQAETKSSAIQSDDALQSLHSLYHLLPLVFLPLEENARVAAAVVSSVEEARRNTKSGKSSKSKSSSSSSSKSSKNSKAVESDSTLTSLPGQDATTSATIGSSTTEASIITQSSTTESPPPITLPPDTTITSGQSCSAPQILPVPTILFDQSLGNITATTTSNNNPAAVCADRFDFPNATVAWYEVTSEQNFCVRLSSYDSPFIVGVLLADDDDCANTKCINESDFASQSIAWRTSPSKTYKLAVSIMPSNTNMPPDGSYLLNIVDAGPDACPEMSDSSELIPFGCPKTQCEKAMSERNCILLDYCNWCPDADESDADDTSLGRCVSRNNAESGGDSCS
jgi:hypothetical protein